MKPIQNFRKHRSKKDEKLKTIFTINYSNKSELFLYTVEEVKRIIPLKLDYTNLADPFIELVRFIYLIDDKEDSIDIPIYKLKDLINMIDSTKIAFLVTKELYKFIDLDNLEKE